MLYLLSPYLNRLLSLLNKKEYLGYLILLFTCWCVIPTFTGQNFQSNQLLWFVFVYSCAGFFKIYCNNINFSSFKCIGYSIFFIILTFLSCIIFDLIGLKISFVAKHSTFFTICRHYLFLMLRYFCLLALQKLILRIINS